MKKVKIILSTLAVMIAVVASLATTTAKNLAFVNVSVKNLTGCPVVGICSTAITTITCKSGTITLAERISATSCAVPAKGHYIHNR